MRLTTPSLLLLTTISHTSVLADIISPLPPSSSPNEARYQPVIDFDRDSCYYTSAIDINGTINPGLPLEGSMTEPCRTHNRLEKSNVYSRKRCNNGWCAYMYEYYFEKDQRKRKVGRRGHTHEWENVVVFVKDGVVRHAMPSCHGKYKDDKAVRLQGDHVKIVYHKDRWRTHCFRKAGPLDDDTENYFQKWFLGSNLVGWDHWPNGTVDVRQKLLEGFTGIVAPKLWDRDDIFTKTLRAAAHGRVEDFDPAYDESEMQIVAIS